MDDNHIRGCISSLKGINMYNNFLDLEPEQNDLLPVNVWPVPYQATVSFGDGTKDGPEAILKASYQIEPYDAELGVDVSTLCSFRTLPFQRPNAAGQSCFRIHSREMHPEDTGHLFFKT